MCAIAEAQRPHGMKSIDVLIADDHPMIVQGLIGALKREGLQRVADAGNPDDVIRLFERLRPDVVVLDIRFGGSTTGLQAARDLLARHPQARIVFYSQFDQDEIVKEAYRLGGMAFVSKSGPPDELTTAIRQAHAGQVYFTSAIANRLALLGVRGDESPQSTLAPRELQVFTLMAQGLTNAEIAERMDLSVKTISNVSQAIKEQLGVHRPADITLLAVKHGLITP
jgi:DNA-binding NarL/FixJ family response regulator